MNVKDSSSSPGAAKAESSGFLSSVKSQGSGADSADQSGNVFEALLAAVKGADSSGKSAKKAPGSALPVSVASQEGAEKDSGLDGRALGAAGDLKAQLLAKLKGAAENSSADKSVDVIAKILGQSGVEARNSKILDAHNDPRLAKAVKAAKPVPEKTHDKINAKANENMPVVTQLLQPIIIQVPQMPQASVQASAAKVPNLTLLQQSGAAPYGSMQAVPAQMALVSTENQVDMPVAAMMVQAQAMPMDGVVLDDSRTPLIDTRAGGGAHAFVMSQHGLSRADLVQVPHGASLWSVTPHALAVPSSEALVASQMLGHAKQMPIAGADEAHSSKDGNAWGTGALGNNVDVGMYLPQLRERAGGAADVFVTTRAVPLDRSQPAVDVYSPTVVAMRVGDLAAHGGGTVRVKVVPESLGELTISVTNNGGKLNVQLNPSSAEAHEVLARHLPELKGMLEASHFQVDRLEVARDAGSMARAVWTSGSGSGSAVGAQLSSISSSAWTGSGSSGLGSSLFQQGHFGFGDSQNQGSQNSGDSHQQWDQYQSQWQERMNGDGRRQDERARRLWQYENALA